MERWLRRLLLASLAATVFGLWLGLLLRMTVPGPRVILRLSEEGSSRDRRECVLTEFSPAGDKLVTCFCRSFERRLSHCGPLEVWETSSGRLLHSHFQNGEPFSLPQVSPDGRSVVLLPNLESPLFILDASTGEQLSLGSFEPLSDSRICGLWEPCFSPNSRYLACAAKDDRHREVVVVWDLGQRREVLRVCDEGAPLAFSEDSQLLATTRLGADVPNRLTVFLRVLSTGGERARFDFGYRSTKWWRSWGGATGLHAAEVTVTDSELNKQVARFEGFVRLRSRDFALLAKGEANQLPRPLSPTILAAEHRPLLGPFRDDPDEISPRPPALRWIRQGYQRNVGQPWRWLSESLFGSDSEQTWYVVEISDRTTDKLVAAIPDRTGKFKLSPAGDQLALLTDHGIQIWDLPPRRPVGLLALLSAVPALLFTGVVWWRLGR